MGESESRSEEHSVISPASASTARITSDNGIVALGPLAVVARQEAGEATSVSARQRAAARGGARAAATGGEAGAGYAAANAVARKWPATAKRGTQWE